MEHNMFKDKVKVTGNLEISLNGKVVRKIKNLVVTAGKEWIASRMQGVADSVMTHMAIGTGSTAAVIGDTTLETELARGALTVSGGSVAGAVITFATTYAAGTGTGAITEAGIFNDATVGDMLARTVFSVVNKGAADSMTLNWSVTIS